MPPKQRIKLLSAEELKSKLYDHMKKSGSIDHLTAQMRGLLVSELFKASEPVVPNKFPNASDTEKCLLPLQVCNWLIYDHLSRQDYQYTLSVFVTEAQLPYPDKFLTAADVLHILGVSHSTINFEQIIKIYSENNELGYLHSLFLAIIKTIFNVSSTDEISSVADSSLKKIDKGVSASASEIHKPEATGNVSLNENISKSKQTNQNISFWSDYDIKTADMSFRERSSSVKGEDERTVQKLRRRLMEELDSLYEQERKRKLEVEVIKSELRKDQYKISKEKEMLKEKEILLEKELTNKFEMKMRDMESNFASKLHFKDKEIESLKSKLLEKDEKIVKIETELASEKDNNKYFKQDHDEIKRLYKIIQDKYSAVLDENTNLIKKFESMADYIILKEELAVKSREVARLQNEIKDIHEKSESERRKFVDSVRNMEDKIKLKDSELTQAREDLDHERKAFNNEKSVWNKEKRKLEKELSESKELYKNMLQRTEDQEEEIADLRRSLNTLNYKCTNNVLNKAKTGGFGSYKNFHIPLDTVQRTKPESLFTNRNKFRQQLREEHIDTENILPSFNSIFNEIGEDEGKTLEKCSSIFSDVHRTFSKTPIKHSKLSEKYRISSPEKYKNHNSNTFPETGFLNSSPNHYNRPKSRLNTYPKSPFSLNDVKQMVAHSLLTGRTSNLTFPDYHSGLPIPTSNTSSQLPNPFNRFTNENVSGIHNIYGSTNKSIIADDSTKLNSKAKTDEHQTATFTSQRQNIAELNVDNMNKSQQERINRSLLENNSKTPFDVNDSVVTPVSGAASVSTCVGISLAQGTHAGGPEVIENTSEHILVQSSQDTHATIPQNSENVPKNIETDFALSSQYKHAEVPEATVNKPKNSEVDLVQSSQTVQDVVLMAEEKKLETSASVFVNLDNAWKSRSTTSYTDHRVLPDVSFKHKTDGGIETRTRGDKQDKHSISITEKEKDTNSKVSEKEIENDISNDGNVPFSNLTSIESENKERKKFSEGESDVSNVKGTSDSVDDQIETELKPEKETSIKNQDNVKSPKNVGSADSVSELSEIHLSCGSEAESHKEDSDAW